MQLLLRNAMQIRSLVKATFAAADFDKPKGCDSPATDADMLACKWNHAMGEVEKYQQSGGNVESSILALAEVRRPQTSDKSILTF
jgi:hypothetical protein